MVLKEGEAIAIGNYNQLINSSLDFLSFLEKEKKEEERKESLTKKKSLSINHREDGGDESIPNGGHVPLGHTLSGRSLTSGQSFHAKSLSGSVGKSFSSTNPFKRQFSRTISMSRSRTSSLSAQSASIQGEEEIMEEVDLGQGMTREEKAQDGSISARVYWDYLR